MPIEQNKPEIGKYGEKSIIVIKIEEGIKAIEKLCGVRKDWVCVNMTKNLEKELKKQGILK